MLIGGDHLLAHISSNPLISRPLTGDAVGARPHALMIYIESMRATRELDLDLVLTGHGEPVTDHVALIDERLRMHDRRAAKLLGMLAPEPLTAYELALRDVGQCRGHAGVSDDLRGARATWTCWSRAGRCASAMTASVTRFEAVATRAHAGELDQDHAVLGAGYAAAARRRRARRSGVGGRSGLHRRDRRGPALEHSVGDRDAQRRGVVRRDHLQAVGERAVLGRGRAVGDAEPERRLSYPGRR